MDVSKMGLGEVEREAARCERRLSALQTALADMVALEAAELELARKLAERAVELKSPKATAGAK